MSKSLEQVFHKIGQPMFNLISDQWNKVQIKITKQY